MTNDILSQLPGSSVKSGMALSLSSNMFHAKVIQFLGDAHSMVQLYSVQKGIRN